ncbi:MAG: P-type conjugative transfer protein TrbL [Nitrosomonas sp.]|nr:P-type conjugative transfer protein TrbL [Nitrosomonas sp.]
MLFSTAAFAELAYIDPATNQGVLDQVTQKFLSSAKNWHIILEAAATRLFWSLVLMSMVWTFGMMILRKADIGDFFAEFTRFIIFTGFFFWLLTNAVSGHNIGGTIIESMQVLGSQASGQTGLAHGNIVEMAIKLWHSLTQNLSVWNPVDSFIAAVLTLIIMIVLTVIAVNMLFLIISSWVLLYAGIFFLGFGGARWTSDIAINYFRTVLSVGIELLAMTLIIGIGGSFLSNYYAKMNQNILNFEELGVMLISAIAFLILTSKIPSMLSSIVTGGGFNSSGVTNYTGGQVMGAAATSLAIASMGMTKAASALGSIASAAKGAMGSSSGMDAVKSADFGSIGGEFGPPRQSKGVSNYPFGTPPERPK